MKIGILICGRAKYDEYFNWNITQVFSKIKNYEFEIYSMTWDTPAANLSNYKAVEYKSQSDILLPLYNRIKEKNKLDKTIAKVFKNHYLGKDDYEHFSNMCGQIAGFYEAYQLIKDTDIEYFIKIRTDMVFNLESFEAGLEKLIVLLRDVKYSKQPGIIIPLSKVFKGHGIIGDWWWAFEKTSMAKMFDNFYQKLEDLHTKDIRYMYNVRSVPGWAVIHSTLSSWLYYNNCHTIDFNYYNNAPIQCILLRNNCQEILPSEINNLQYQDWVEMYYDIQEQFCVSPVD